MDEGRRGFTLIELLVVVGICGLLLSFSFPALSNFRKGVYLESSAREIASEIRKAQSLAMSVGETQSVGKFKFSRTGFPLPGGSGTETIGSRKIIVSSVGRVRIE